MAPSPQHGPSPAPGSDATSGGLARHLSGMACVARRSSGGAPGRTIVETAACPPELKRGPNAAWSFADFRVQRLLGEGNMSSVLHCVDRQRGQAVVVKMYHKERMNSMNVTQVSREIELHASLLHPNIVKLYAAFEDSDGIYLVEELAPRGDLYGELSCRGGYMSESQVAKNVLLPFLSALSYMHDRGILHRDIKPENVMLGEDSEVKLGDFGLAINTLREKPQSRVGTLDYMPPEIARLPYGTSRSASIASAGTKGSSSSGASTPSSDAPPESPAACYGLPADVWCVGILAYELLVGSPPFEAETKDATYTRILKIEPHIPSRLSEPARDFITQASSSHGRWDMPLGMRSHPSLVPCPCPLQRPRSMHLLNEAALIEEQPVTARRGTAEPSPAAMATAVAAVTAALPASAAASAGGVGERGAPLARAISVSSPLARRFTPKPSKPAALNQMVLRHNHLHAHSGAPAAAGAPAGAAGAWGQSAAGADEDAGDTIPAVGAAEGGRGSKLLAAEGSGAKLAIHADATSAALLDQFALLGLGGSSSGTGSAAGSGSSSSTSSGGAPTPSGSGDHAGLIRAITQGKAVAADVQTPAGDASRAGEQGVSGGSGSSGGTGGRRPSSRAFATFRRKLSSKNFGNVLSSLVPSSRSSGSEGSVAGPPDGRLSGVQAVQAPTMAELLSPGPTPARGPHAGKRNGKLLSAFSLSRKISLGGHKLSGGLRRTASRLSATQPTPAGDAA
eukprot:scaffold4.g4640.t1